MEIIFLIVLLVVAYLYSSVGHGGASGYLAMMALFGIEMVYMKPSALILNLFVSLIAFIAYYRGGHFRFKILLPFVITSIPMAFLGAKLEISPELYKKILGACLIIATLRIVIQPGSTEGARKHLPVGIALVTGAVVGYFSGMIGIGGGIILSPLLLLTRWTSMKETAAVSAAFIFLNSSAGLAGHISAGMEVPPQIFVWVLVAVLGGLAGSYSGSFRYSVNVMKYVVTAVLILACIKLYIF
ncbi:MAG TPA: sulfite exporter TauE/SafE family protein [Bacteroides sp.]|nr:sulfite exporter TauE/SafE family protein [Bacteroides sp.]